MSVKTPIVPPDLFPPGLKASLERLQLDYVDVVFANRPDPNTPMEGGFSTGHPGLAATGGRGGRARRLQAESHPGLGSAHLIRTRLRAPSWVQNPVECSLLSALPIAYFVAK